MSDDAIQAERAEALATLGPMSGARFVSARLVGKLLAFTTGLLAVFGPPIAMVFIGMAYGYTRWVTFPAIIAWSIVGAPLAFLGVSKVFALLSERLDARLLEDAAARNKLSASSTAGAPVPVGSQVSPGAKSQTDRL